MSKGLTIITDELGVHYTVALKIIEPVQCWRNLKLKT